MAATNFTPISLYYTTTAAAAPVAGNLVNGELAINITDGKLYYKNNAGVVTLLASTSGASGDVVGPASATDNALARFDLTTGKLIQNSVGILSDAGILTGLTGLTSSGSITFSSLTSGRVTYAGASGLLSDSANLTFDGTSLTLGGQILLSNNNYIGFKNTSASVAASIFNDTSNFLNLYNSSNTGTIFYVNAGERLRLTNTTLYTASGVKVGIGLSNPATTLDIVVPTGTASIKVGDGTVSGAAYINLQGVTGAKTWFISSNYNVGGALEFTQSTANGGSTIAGTASMLLDSSGNLGLGVTPSAWSVGKAIEIGNVGNAVWGVSATQITMPQNAYFNGAWRYGANGLATRYAQEAGVHQWWNAPSGTAGNAVTFTQAMTLDASGNLGIGTTSPSSFTTFPSKLVVGNGTGGQHITIYSGTASEGDIVFADGTTGTDQYRGTFRYDHADDSMKFYTGGGTLGIVQNASGNLGLGVTPSAWEIALGSRAIQFTGSAVYGYRDTNLILTQNAYFDGAFKYYASSIASAYYGIGSGVHAWYTAPSGTANATATFTQAMTLNADGTLGIGSTGAGNKLTVSNAGANGFEVDPLSASGTKTKLLSLNRTTSAYTPFLYDASLHEFQISGGPKMTLDASGNLGIGATTVAGKLHVMKTATGGSPQNPAGNQIVMENGDSSGSADLQFLSANNGYNHIFFGDAADANIGTLLYDHNDNSMQFVTNTAERMRITSTGTVYLASGGLFGVGVTSPAGAIGIGVSPMTNQLILGGNTTDTTYGAISFSGDNSGANRIGLTGGGGSDKALYLDSPTGGAFYFRINAVNRQEISSSGIVTMSAYGVGTATFAANGTISSVSDETWKTKDGVPTNTDAMLQKLEPGYWFYNEEKAPIFGADRQLGFYAQNVHEAIGAEAAPTPEEGKPWGYYDRSVLAVVVMSLKTALNTIEELKQRIETLENK